MSRAFVGTLVQRGAQVRFAVHPSYADDPMRPVLGLLFENDLSRVHAARTRLPPWFSNLLPEGVLRRWVAREAGVPTAQEVDLIARVGHDLPGAVTLMPLPAEPVLGDVEEVAGVPSASPAPAGDERGRFSLAGVQLKLSMVATGDRLVVPLGGELGDWIVKFPDSTLPRIPVVEHVTMALAHRVGIDVPETRLVDRDLLPGTPDALWAGGEHLAYAVRRFDRGPDRALIHIEDLAQVRGLWPEQKYDGSYEGLAALVHRGVDTPSLHELVRRVAFSLLVANSDAHLKNWSLIYRDPRRPVLSPACDLVSAAPYEGHGSDIALTLAGTHDAGEVRLADIGRLGRTVGVGSAELIDIADRTVSSVVSAWPALAEEHLSDHPHERATIGGAIVARAATLRS